MNKRLHPSNSNDSIQRPRVLGWLILAAGGFSAWYWYKPLPPDTTQAAFSSWEKNSSEGASWSDTSLIRPSLEELDSNVSAGTPSMDEVQQEWGGSRKHALIPVPNQYTTLGDILAAEPQPTQPVLSGASSPLMTPKPWTESTSTSGMSTEITSSPWPDTAHSLAGSKPELSTHPSIPSLLGPGHKHFASSKIRTQEDESDVQRTSPTPPRGNVPQAIEQPMQPPPNRSPQFIRQPKKSL